MKTHPQPRPSRRIDLLVLAVYILLSLALSWPLPARLGRDVAGRYVDARVFQWNNWWVKTALSEGLDLDHTRHMYAPSGVSLVSHNFNWVNSFLSVPLDWAFGPIAAYNLLFLMTIWLSGFAMYLLALHLTGRRDAAFLAGLIFAFFPYHLSGNWDGQMNLANVQWLPLFVLFLLRTVERKRVGDALLAGLFLALAGLDCWFFLIFVGMWGVVWLIYSAITECRQWSWRAVGLLLLTGGVGVVLMSPFLLPVLAETTGRSVEAAVAYHAEDKASDLLAFVVPNSDHPLLGEWVRSVYERFRHWRPASLGIVALLLALYASLARFRRSLLWLLTGLLFAGLALGTTLTVNGVPYPNVPTPYRLLTGLWPALQIVRQANRFNVMVGLSLAVLVGIGWADLLDRLSATAPGTGARSGAKMLSVYSATLTASVCALLLFEYLAVPCPLQPGAVSPFYYTLAQEPAPAGTLLELPIDDFHSRESLYPQTVHGFKLINGYVARMPPGTLSYIRAQPLIKRLHLQMEVDPGLLDVERQIDLLAANDVRYVVIHKRALPPQPPVDAGVLASWQVLFGPQAHYEDEELVVYRLPSEPNIPKTPILQLGEELGVTQVRVRRTWLRPPDVDDAAGICRSCAEPALGKGWLTVDLIWTALQDLERSYAVRLRLLAPNGTPAAYGETVRISPRYPTSRWPKGVVIADQYALPIHPALPAGGYHLSIEVTEDATDTRLAVAEVPVQVEDEVQPLVPTLANMQHPAGITYGDEIYLLGYDVTQKDGRLHVALYWQALTAIQLKYKFFVHLLSTGDGAMVAQHDGMPRNWSYPTSLWGRSEVFIERLALELPEGALDPPASARGLYRLAVGVYSVETGRLAAVDEEGERLPDDQTILEVFE